MSERREGEAALDFDPAELQGDGHVVFIGRVSSPWKSRDGCPRNMADARETGQAARLTIDAPYRPGLAGLERFSHIVLLSWFDRSRRNLIVQNPRHAEAPRGTFSLRSPVRPDPIGMHVAKLLSLDAEAGLIGIDAIDLLDGTPVIDVKPYFTSIDSFPDATKS